MGDAKSGDEETPKQSIWQRDGDSILGGLAISVLAMGTIVYHLIEGWSWVDSFYFSSVAVTTVGFGDLTPSTDLSKLFTVFYIFSGMTLIALWLNNRFQSRAHAMAEKTPKIEHIAKAIDDAGKTPDETIPPGER
jgi:voltage-gated potassium channel Kch